MLLSRICQPCVTYNQCTCRGLTESSTNHYDVLGLKPTASPSQIKSAYYQLSKKYHPDVAVGVDNAREKFARLSSAYEVLGNPSKRAVYDRSLHPSISRSDTRMPGSNIDADYREFMRQRGSFHARTGGQASPGTSGRIRYDYEEFFRQQHYGRTMNWEARKNFEQKVRQHQAAQTQLFWLFMMLVVGLSLGANNS